MGAPFRAPQRLEQIGEAVLAHIANQVPRPSHHLRSAARRSILILGSGLIVIGQAAEFDYSGTEAVRALREEGYRVILVNSNPATIMIDPDVGDAT